MRRNEVRLRAPSTRASCAPSVVRAGHRIAPQRVSQRSLRFRRPECRAPMAAPAAFSAGISAPSASVAAMGELRAPLTFKRRMANAIIVGTYRSRVDAEAARGELIARGIDAGSITVEHSETAAP